MTHRIEFLFEARAEFDDAANWYEEQEEGLKTEFVRAIDTALQRARTSPYAFPVVEPPSVRRIIVSKFPYSIIYSVESEVIIVYAVFHQSRDPLIWRGRIG